MGLPGVSLQLGPWESELVDNLRTSSAAHGVVVKTITHKDGLPLILSALSSPIPVQVIAALDPHALARMPGFASDSLFATLIALLDAPVRPLRSLSSTAIAQTVVSILREVLEMAETETLGLYSMDAPVVY